MSDAKFTGETPEAFDVTKAGPLTLHNCGISFAVDGSGAVLRYPDGTPIDGQQIEDAVNRSGRRLTNAEAAGHLIAAKTFANGVEAQLNELRATEPVVGEIVDPDLI